MSRRVADALSLGIPVVSGVEIAKYMISDKDSKECIGHVTRTISKVSDGVRQSYRIDSRTQYDQGISVDETCTLDITDILKPVLYRRITRSKSGNTMTDATMMYEDESLDLPTNCAPPTTVGFLLRGSHFAPKGKNTVHIMMPEGKYLKTHGTTSREKVTVPAGTFECYKIELVADADSMMELMPMASKIPAPFRSHAIQHFMPPINYWFSRETPHHPLRFEGFVNSPLTSPPQTTVEELISVEIADTDVVTVAP